MLLSETVKVAPRYQRAIRIDTDFGDSEALEGFICPESSKQSLQQICGHISKTGQSAFTWTGPYGCGKSSLAIALGAILKGNKDQRTKSMNFLGSDLSEEVWGSLKPNQNGWFVLPLVGYRQQPHTAIIEGLIKNKLSKLNKKATEKEVLNELLKIANKDQKGGGLILLLDEMGKFLEHAADQQKDIYFFQELAELASRSKGRLILIGILHQAFDQYAGSLTKESRDSWAKIQGRFIDIPINVAGEEQIELLSRAIINESIPNKHKSLSKTIGQLVLKLKPGVSNEIINSLTNSWPLHPVVSSLLGPISRRQFGQNQRSIFGFLNSAEPNGFQDFITNTEDKHAIYSPTDLWEYLRSNLEPVILASSDSHRWSLAIDATERAELSGADDTHLDLLKIIALINVFSERSGLEASMELLSASLQQTNQKKIQQSLDDLIKWSTIVYRKHLKGYALFAGSDFEFEAAFKRAKERKPTASSFTTLDQTIQLKPILSKRFYDEFGSQHWFNLSIVPLSEVEAISSEEPAFSSLGQFLFVLNDQDASQNDMESLCEKISKNKTEWINVIGCPTQKNKLNDYAEELSVLEHMWKEFPELSNDSVARREIEYQSELIESMIQLEFQKVFTRTTWFESGVSKNDIKNSYDLSIAASEFTKQRITDSPIIKNELVNRRKPSATANSAIKKLLKRMVLFEGSENLEIVGAPAEWGILQSILVKNNLYKKTNDDQWNFFPPKKGDENNLFPAWKKGLDHLKNNKTGNVSVSDIYDIWSSYPFGIKQGLHNIMIVLMILSEKGNLAFYRENIFQSNFTDLDIDYLTNDPSSIQLRWMDLDQSLRELLSNLTSLVEELTDNQIEDADSLSIARALIAIFDALEPSTKRTQRLSKETRDIRMLFKKSSDPNKFLFDDLPAFKKVLKTDDVLDEAVAITNHIKNALKEMIAFYPEWMIKIRSQIFDLMQVYSTSENSIRELRKRAENVGGVSGNPRLEAFIIRLKSFDIGGNSMDEIASLSINKPTKDWVDNDFDQASIELANLALEFIRLESLAFVKGKETNQSSLSIIVGENGRNTVQQDQFLISKEDKSKANKLSKNIQSLLRKEKYPKKILLSAISEAAMDLMEKDGVKKRK